MNEPYTEPDATGTDGRPDQVDTGAPRWVKVFGVIALVLMALVLLLLLTGGGEGHGPGRHTSAPGAAGRPSPPGGSIP